MNNKKKTYSIRTRVITAFLGFAIIQTAVFLCIVFSSGIMRRVYDQSYNSFNGQVVRRSQVLNESLNGMRASFVPLAKQIQSDIEDYLTQEGAPRLGMSSAQAEAVLALGSDYLIDFLNASKEVSGVFLFLENGTNERDCVYIRDNSYAGAIRSDNSKVYVRGPASIAKERGFQLYYLWQQRQNFLELTEKGLAEFYYKPLVAASKKDMDYNDLYYWSRPFALSQNDPEMITLTMPLLDAAGEAYGVCGFEISMAMLQRMLPFGEISSLPSMYVVSGETLAENPEYRIISGVYANQYAKELFQSEDFTQSAIESEFRMTKITKPGANLPTFLCISEPLTLYGKTSPFAKEAWTLYGLTDEKTIDDYPRVVMNTIVISQAIILLLSIIYVVVMSLRLTRPIERLSALVRSVDPEEQVALPKTNISEIDELTGALELSSKAVVASASRLNTVIDMVGVTVGAFEIHPKKDEVLITESLTRLLEFPPGAKKVDCRSWEEKMARFEPETYEDVYLFRSSDGEEKWLRKKITTAPDGDIISGVIIDVSDEIRELRRVEYERDYDGLTQILNRRAFMTKLKHKIDNNIYKKGVLILIDLDNLKYVNDNFGHDIGDAYLKKMAEALRNFEKDGGLISRMAGDEFTVFFPADGDEPAFRNYVSLILDICKRNSIPLPDGQVQRLRFSSGIAWYPKDSADVDTLIRYADFAMYETKHNIKGTVGEFNIDIYNQKSTLMDKVELLDMLIEKEDVKYMVQPIVSAVDGEVYAYEMLMRSDANGLKTPYEILNLAKSQSKLYYIELIGMKKMFQFVADKSARLAGKQVFFNTLPNIVLKQDDWKTIAADFKHLFPRVVVEFTENEDGSEASLKEKSRQFRELGSRIAIDDFGSGYNGEVILMKASPEFVKIDMSLVRDIHLDGNKRDLVRNIIGYCKERGIKTIAEGIESFDEMKKINELGVDYYQGFYLSRPSFDILDIPEQIKRQIKGLNS